MAKITVAEAFELLKDVNKNISNIGSNQRLRMASMLNRQLADALEDAAPEQLEKEFTYTVSQGNGSDTFPVDFQDVDGLDLGFFPINDQGEKEKGLVRIRDNDNNAEGYTTTGIDTVNFRNIRTAGSVLMRYNSVTLKFTTETGVGGEFVVDDRWEELVQAGMLHRYAVFDSKSLASDEASASARFNDLLDDFKVRIKQTPNVMVFRK